MKFLSDMDMVSPVALFTMYEKDVGHELRRTISSTISDWILRSRTQEKNCHGGGWEGGGLKLSP